MQGVSGDHTSNTMLLQIIAVAQQSWFLHSTWLHSEAAKLLLMCSQGLTNYAMQQPQGFMQVKRETYAGPASWQTWWSVWSVHSSSALKIFFSRALGPALRLPQNLSLPQIPNCVPHMKEGYTFTSKCLIDSKHGYSRCTNSSQQCLDLELLADVWFLCFSLVGKKFTSITYLVSQLYMYNFLASSASYRTVHKFGDSKNPKQHLTTEDWAHW